MPKSFINALLQVKAAAAKANVELDQIPESIGNAIRQSLDDLLANNDFMRHFPINIFQTGS